MPKKVSKKAPPRRDATSPKPAGSRVSIPASKPAPKPATSKPMGRPPADPPRKTISFRIPVAVEDAFKSLAEKDSKARDGGSVTASALYNAAFARYLTERRMLIKGYND